MLEKAFGTSFVLSIFAFCITQVLVVNLNFAFWWVSIMTWKTTYLPLFQFLPNADLVQALLTLHSFLELLRKLNTFLLTVLTFSC